ncbi:hypothetical protein BGW80DRAFT_1248461 [Lactifluus volemus]|nr:hypothetical protein BGW80DRAFT_1248461 [Lactifluus volemus]
MHILAALSNLILTSRARRGLNTFEPTLMKVNIPPKGIFHIFVSLTGNEGFDLPGIRNFKREIERGSRSSLSYPLALGNYGIRYLSLHSESAERLGASKTGVKLPLLRGHSSFLTNFIEAAYKWYEPETERWTAIQDLLEANIGLKFSAQKIPNAEYVTDGNLPATIMPAAIRGCKGECEYALNLAAMCYGR